MATAPQTVTEMTWNTAYALPSGHRGECFFCYRKATTVTREESFVPSLRESGQVIPKCNRHR